MKLNILHLTILIGVIIMAIGCTQQISVTSAEGLRPIYASGDDLNISLQEPRSYEQLGQIVYVEPYILIGEVYRGIHVVDNRDPNFPTKLSFINIPGASTFTVGNGVIYATSGKDLVTVTYDGELLSEQSRIANYFNGNDAIDQISPINYSGYFECVDPTQGTVIGWREDIIDNPECRTD